jgi:predicted nucleic acid-binding protein
MSGVILRCVLDASVGIKLFVEEEFSDKVQTLFAKLAEDPQAEIHVPDLFYIECANILLKYTRRYKCPIEDLLADIEDLNKLALKSTSTADLIEDALLLANEKKIDSIRCLLCSSGSEIRASAYNSRCSPGKSCRLGNLDRGF